MKAMFHPNESSIRPPFSPHVASPTRERVLEVACILFAEAGFHGTHLREVCKRAGANIAGVCYHFRSKQGLYEAVIMEACRQLYGRDDKAPGAPTVAQPAQRLGAMVGSLFEKLSGDHVWIAKLLARELVAPVCGREAFAGSGLERDLILLQGVVRDLLGPQGDDEMVRLHTFSVVNECLFYSLAADNLSKVLPDLGRGLPNRASMARHVTRRCLGALERERREPTPSTT